MKKATKQPLTDEEIMAYDNVPIDVAARYIGWSSPTIYRALREERAPFGFAVCSEETGTWTYNISPGLLVKYKRGDLPTYRLRELEEVMVRHVQEALDLRLAGVSALMGKVLSMSMIRLELSNRDYNTIAEALLESALDWEHAADELGRLHQFCARTGDPAYGAKLARLDREQYRHRRLARRRRAVLERLQKQKEAESC